MGEMRTRTRELVSHGDRLFAKRAGSGLLSLWQTMAENFHVMRADFTRSRTMGEEFASYLMTGRPALAHRDLSNSIGAMMRPRDRQWLTARTHDENINNDRDARAYLDWMSQIQFRGMYDARAGLSRATKEADGDWSAFGNAALTVEANKWRDGLMIRCWHLRDVVWTEDTSLKINQVHHKKQLSARDQIGLYGKAVHANVTEQLQKNPEHEFHCRRIIMPSDEYDLPIKNKGRFPFVCIDVDVENSTILAETPARGSMYVIPRWATVSGSQYAYSPATVYGLPDARTLQQITLTMIEAGQKATDPPMIAVTEAIAGGVNSGAGMITWTDADYDERTGEVLRPMEMRFDGIRFGAEREERVEGTLDATFFLNQIRMPQITKEMTAYESSKVYEEFQRNALPLLEPVEVDYNGGLCSACFDVMQTLINPASGAPYFGSPLDMPQILRNQELRWEFDTPLKAAAEQAKIFTYSSFTDVLAKGMQIDPGVARNADLDKATREALVATGGARWVRKEEDVEADKAKDAQMAQAKATADAMATGADVASRVSDAVTSASGARDAVMNGMQR